jgi:hypothetical protein
MSKARNLANLLSDGVISSDEISSISIDNIPDASITGAKLVDNTITDSKVSLNATAVDYSNTVSGISANTVQEAIDYLNVLSGGSSSGDVASYTRDNFTATEGQTVFTTSNGYTLGYLQVFVNGVLIAPSDYTANDESTVTLTVAASANDEIVIIALDSFAIQELLRVTSVSASAADDSLTIGANGVSIKYGNYLSFNGADTFTSEHGYVTPHHGFGQSDGAYPSTLSSYHGLDIAANGVKRMNISRDGLVTMPYQPSFAAYKANDNNYAPVSPLDWITTHNTGNHFNGKRFTAPVSGLYHFEYGGITHAVSNYFYIGFGINGSNTNQPANGSWRHLPQTTAEYNNMQTSLTVYLNAGDYVEAWTGYNGGTPYLESARSGFSGYLVG